jgi:hypothetical protein
VIVSADDLVEPIVCFSSEGSYDLSEHNPLAALVSRDIPARVNASRSVHKKLLAGGLKAKLTEQEARVHESGEKALGKWTELFGSGAGFSVSAAHKTGISDVRVAPLLRTKWGQTVDASCYNACFNYYTPGGYGEGDASNYPAGCVATAMAQYMRFWQYPVSGVGTRGFTITVDGYGQTAYLRGGDGSGGAYNWSQMPYVPDCCTTTAERSAIGALMYDAGVAVGMDYWADGSGADLSYTDAALVDTFGYSNAIYGYNYNNEIGAGLNAMINPNLDYGNPVILGIHYSTDASSGHAIVTDGYGYQSSTLYHHLNMGWNGRNDIWYNLPNIDASLYSFNIVDAAIYNIYISGLGEIISGRVSSPGSKLPISGATVTAVRAGGGETYQAVTNTKGIYTFAKVPSNSTYTISVAKSGYTFAHLVTSTGQSLDNEATSGNCWAIDFVSVAMVAKCTVKAGTNNDDAISFSGTINVTANDFDDANNSGDANFIEVTISDENSDDMVPRVVTFPVNGKTWKKGKFNYSVKENGVKKSFSYNVKTGKFACASSKINLSGLECPMIIDINVGNFVGTAEVNESIVNGKKPIPIKLLMGVKNSLRADKWKFTRDRHTDNITRAAVSGGFSVGDLGDANMATHSFSVTVGPQTFTVPAVKFKANKKGDKFTCSKVILSGGEIAYATFDFSKCTFTLTIKNTNLAADAGETDFLVDFASFSGSDEVSLP